MIPGWLIALVTFPGVIVHETAHLFFCKLRGVAVLDVCYFQISGNPAGYVWHEEPPDFTSSFLISLGPFFINSLLCAFFCFPAFIPVKVFNEADVLSYFLIWLGISIGMHAFPSTQDAQVLLHHAKKAVGLKNPLAVISYPIVIVIYAANIGRFLWLDYVYGLALGLLLPELLLKQLA